MPDRKAQIEHFLKTHGFEDCSRTNLAGDASNRRYDRLCRTEDETFVLMDAPPEKGEDVRPFVRIASFLSGAGLSSPSVRAKDEESGFLILEDLGDDLFAKVVVTNPEMEGALYAAATDLLIELHQHPPPKGLPSYDAVTAADLSALAMDWYARGALGTKNSRAREKLGREVSRLIGLHASDCDVLVQRDYHSENLLWLGDRKAHKRIGLLDFQDALVGHVSYDLVSLLQDARRDVPEPIEAEMINRYIYATGQDSTRFRTAYAVWGAQRNLRILGVFARLCMRDGKAPYIRLIPRVWSLLMRDLEHQELQDLKSLVEDMLPLPSPDVLARLEEQCAPTQ